MVCDDIANATAKTGVSATAVSYVKSACAANFESMAGSRIDSGKALTELHSSDGVVTYGGAVPFTLLVDSLQAEVGIVL